jgi:hypothetical protein
MTTTFCRFKILAVAIEHCLQQFDESTLAIVDGTYFENFADELSRLVMDIDAIEFRCLPINEINQLIKYIETSLPLFNNIYTLVEVQIENKKTELKSDENKIRAIEIIRLNKQLIHLCRLAANLNISWAKLIKLNTKIANHSTLYWEGKFFVSMENVWTSNDIRFCTVDNNTFNKRKTKQMMISSHPNTEGPVTTKNATLTCTEWVRKHFW